MDATSLPASDAGTQNGQAEAGTGRPAGPPQREFEFTGPSGAQVGFLWPAAGSRRAPVVLTAHLGSTHKGSAEILDWARVAAGSGQAHVIAIDGPVHGQNSDHAADRARVLADFRALWHDGGDGGIAWALESWGSALAAVRSSDLVDIQAVGWFGLSMGTAYGIPFLAEHQEIRAAVLGMWSLAYPNSARIAAAAPAVTCPVLFQERQDDERFAAADQRSMFGRFRHPDNVYRQYPGGHVPPGCPQLLDARRFLARHLGPYNNGPLPNVAAVGGQERSQQ